MNKTSISLYKNHHFYTAEHNALMVALFISLPGVTVTSEDEIFVHLDCDEQTMTFLNHFADCDMVVFES